MSSHKHTLLLAFYGDDFTGSTDALEFLSKAGAKTILFIEPPTVKQLNRYRDLDAIGVAGMTRSMTPGVMEKELRPAFAALKELGASHIHYKVCSTFDSSPAIGSIGKAIDIGAEIFPSSFIPLLVAAPALGRYCAFGNLFARMGIGSQGKIYRLDRHPSMIKHPVTPSDESDLRLHLAKQTSKQIGLIDILQVALNEPGRNEALTTAINNGAEVVLFDALNEEQMAGIGKLIDSYSAKENTLFSVGSSGIEMALGNYWKEKGILKEEQNWIKPLPAEVLLVASGSCSPVTSGQIKWALKNGFTEIILDTNAITNGDSSAINKNISAAIININKGKSVIVHTNCGNESINSTNSSLTFGTALGNIAKAVAENTTLTRIVIAGGDTSSYAARAMGIESVEMIAPLSPGAPLCKAYAPGSPIDGLEINFKGGQVGSEDYFGMVLNGSKLK